MLFGVPQNGFLRFKCVEFNFGRGSTPEPAGGAYSAPKDPWAWPGEMGGTKGRERTSPLS